MLYGFKAHLEHNRRWFCSKFRTLIDGNKLLYKGAKSVIKRHRNPVSNRKIPCKAENVLTENELLMSEMARLITGIEVTCQVSHLERARFLLSAIIY